MNWKKYKALPTAEKRNESYYIVGLDLGNDSSGIAFYNLALGTPEVIDLSGGYGKPSIPTVMQYIAESKEWVFGEYAVLNRGAGTELTLGALIERLGNFDYIDVDRRSLSVASLLALFIKELLGNVRSINPKAEIVGIVATVPAYFSEQAHEELQRAFKLAGYEKELIALVPDRECVLAHYYKNAPPLAQRVLLLDFGARELRGGLYHVEPSGKITSLSSLFSGDISVAKINNNIADFFEDFVRRQVGNGKPLSFTQARQLHEHVVAFTHQHRDMLFQKNIQAKPIKMYFNFCYPPFQQTVTHEQVTQLIRPYKRRLESFVQDVLEKSISNAPVSHGDVDVVLCVGGGFEMQWAKEAIGNLFATAQLHHYKNAKMVFCEGAAIVAARALGIEEAGTNLPLQDAHQLTCDIGLASGSNFLPIVERNAFWWQSHAPKLVLVNHEINGELDLFLCKRERSGEVTNVATVRLSGLPTRPKGTTRLEVGLSFASNEEAVLTVRDMGFGEMFPRVEYEAEFNIKLD